mmetsp:Transcript_23126/g.39746  ORF Transcript_23126/g.39746 Transcript_23126/m.39746 type:complete len:224 (+) Transcript_23126:870-1541(+)
MTSTSPLLIWFASTASSASSSLLNTRAGPRCSGTFLPESLMTAPSGARLPRITITCFRGGAYGSSSAKITSWFAGRDPTYLRFSAMVLPVTVRQSPCSRPASSSVFMTIGTPPMLSRSSITYLPKGLKSPMRGTRAATRLKSSIDSATWASWARARRCSTAFVDPPSAIMTVMAFSNAGRVIMSRARMPRSRHVKRALTDSMQSRRFLAEMLFEVSTAGWEEE